MLPWLPRGEENTGLIISYLQLKTQPEALFPEKTQKLCCAQLEDLNVSLDEWSDLLCSLLKDKCASNK